VRGRRHGQRDDRRARLTPLPPLETLEAGLRGRRLPGAELTIERRESVIADEALRAPDAATDVAHPIWFVIASLRGLGISMDELCDLAGKRDVDTLLYGGVEIVQAHPLLVGETYRTTAEVTGVGRKTTRDGSALDMVDVVVRVLDVAQTECGSVTSTYLFKRGVE
jgi:hypothetical protein